jgi:transcription elongation factor GreA
LDSNAGNLSLGEAASHFLANLSPGERETNQPEIYKFIRWFGWEQPFSSLTAAGVANYAERLSLSDTDYTRKLEMVRVFLNLARKEGWSKSNLATHLKARKGKAPLVSQSRNVLPEPTALTQQGYAELEAELAVLEDKRTQVTQEMQRAAADKDFRENAPLQAAREEKGHIEGRIKALEQTLKSANIVEEKQGASFQVAIGDRVVLCDSGSDEEQHYILVSPREVDPSKGKISTASPLGKAIIGRRQGEVVEVTTPAGKLHYQIKQIER